MQVFLMVVCLLMSRASRVIVTVSQTAELFLLKVLIISSFIFVFHEKNSTDFFRIISDLCDCKESQFYFFFFLSPLFALYSKCVCFTHIQRVSADLFCFNYVLSLKENY